MHLVALFVAVCFIFLIGVGRLWWCLQPRQVRRGKKKKNKTEKCRTLAVLGSGGHTTEMIALLKSLDMSRYGPIQVVLAASDATSLPKLRQVPELTENVEVHQVYRSREVGQSFTSSIFSTIFATYESIKVVFTSRPELLLCNGPGTCVPVCGAALLLRFLGLGDPYILFAESFCRVETLSLTGRILYPLADNFVVQWPQLIEKYPKAKYIGVLF